MASTSNKSIEDIRKEVLQVKNETVKNANTATRVGGVMEDMVDHVEEFEGSVAGSIKQAVDVVDAKTQNAINAQKKEIDDFKKAVTDQVTNYKPIVVEGNVTNAQDEEDLTSVDGLLKLKDRSALDGMGYVILRKNKSFASQITGKTNTVFVIRYNFEVGGTSTAPTSMPDNCVLKFEGGSLTGGFLKLNRTLIDGNAKFSGVTFSGTILNDDIKISWFTTGMSSTTDFSISHNDEIISAMKLASCGSRKWLDLEKIPLLVRGEILITDVYGNIGIKRARILFVSTKDGDCTLRYKQSTTYKGSYSPIIDSAFSYVGDGTVSATTGRIYHANVSCIFKDDWSDTAFTYWRDIVFYNYTGYFMVNTNYLQEVTFTNISGSGSFGFISYNSDGIYTSSGGSQVGSSNIVHFLNCNLNNGGNPIKRDGGKNVKYIWDFANCMEVHLVNIVSQGSMGTGGTDAIALHITDTRGKGNINNRSTFTIEGFWVEYSNASSIAQIEVDNMCICLSVKQRNVTTVRFINSCIGTYDIQTSEIVTFENIIKELEISNDSTINVNFNSYAYGGLGTRAIVEKLYSLIESGRVKELNNMRAPWRDKSAPLQITPSYEVDIKRLFIKGLASPISARTHIRKRLYHENNIAVFAWEESGTSMADSMYFFSPISDASLTSRFPYTELTMDKDSCFVEMIYRARVLVDVTEDNISNVYCQTRGMVNVAQGSYYNMITPEVGMLAGECTEWTRHMRNASDASYKMDVKLRNCSLEIAMLRVCKGNISFDSRVKYDSNTKSISKPNIDVDTFVIDVDSDKDNASYLSTYIVDANPYSLYETPKNVYRKVDGGLIPLHTEAGKTRPTLTTTNNGYQFFDTTLNKPIYWTGSKWVDATGADV